MNKPEYGSLHKFLVSLGLILLALPLVLLYFFTRTDFLLLTRAEYAKLSDFSLHQLQQYNALMSQLETLFPALCIVSLAGGIALLYKGIIGWAPVQRDLDDIIKADLNSRELDNKRMSSSEVLEKAEREAEEAEEVNAPAQENALPPPPQPEAPPSEPEPKAADTAKAAPPEPAVPSKRDASSKPVASARSTAAAARKYLEIEGRYFAFLRRSGALDYYRLERNIRLDRFSYDAIAVSERDNIDIIYEVKYWRRMSSLASVQSVLQHLESAGVNYERLRRRNFRCVLVIVMPDELIARARSLYSAAPDSAPGRMEIDFISEVYL